MDLNFFAQLNHTEIFSRIVSSLAAPSENPYFIFLNVFLNFKLFSKVHVPYMFNYIEKILCTNGKENILK